MTLELLHTLRVRSRCRYCCHIVVMLSSYCRRCRYCCHCHCRYCCYIVASLFILIRDKSNP